MPKYEVGDEVLYTPKGGMTVKAIIDEVVAYNMFRIQENLSHKYVTAMDYELSPLKSLDQRSCRHQWVETMLLYGPVWDCSLCGIKKEDL